MWRGWWPGGSRCQRRYRRTQRTDLGRTNPGAWCVTWPQSRRPRNLFRSATIDAPVIQVPSRQGDRNASSTAARAASSGTRPAHQALRQNRHYRSRQRTRPERHCRTRQQRQPGLASPECPRLRLPSEYGSTTTEWGGRGGFNSKSKPNLPPPIPACSRSGRKALATTRSNSWSSAVIRTLTGASGNRGSRTQPRMRSRSAWSIDPVSIAALCGLVTGCRAGNGPPVPPHPRPG